MSTPKTDTADERAEFEKWHASLGRPEWMRSIRASGIAAGEYADLRAEAEWDAWQARAALASRAEPPVSEAQNEPTRRKGWNETMSGETLGDSKPWGAVNQHVP